MYYFHKWGKAALSKLGQSLPDGNITNSTNQEAEIFLLVKYILVSERTQLQWRFSLERNTCLFSSYASITTRVNELLFCQMLCVPWLFTRGISSLKPTKKVFSFMKKPDLLWKSLLFKSKGKQHTSSKGDHRLMAIYQAPQKERLEASNLQCML